MSLGWEPRGAKGSLARVCSTGRLENYCWGCLSPLYAAFYTEARRILPKHKSSVAMSLLKTLRWLPQNQSWGLTIVPKVLCDVGATLLLILLLQLYLWCCRPCLLCFSAMVSGYLLHNLRTPLTACALTLSSFCCAMCAPGICVAFFLTSFRALLKYFLPSLPWSSYLK